MGKLAELCTHDSSYRGVRTPASRIINAQTTSFSHTDTRTHGHTDTSTHPRGSIEFVQSIRGYAKALNCYDEPRNCVRILGSINYDQIRLIVQRAARNFKVPTYSHLTSLTFFVFTEKRKSSLLAWYLNYISVSNVKKILINVILMYFESVQS